MVKCTQCGDEIPAGENFCLGCGAPRPANGPTTMTQTGPAVPPQTGTPVRTLMFGDQKIPLMPGVFKIARIDSPASPDLKIDSGDVSGTPLELTITDDGKVSAVYQDTRECAWQVIKALKPGAPMEIEPGETIIAGAANLLVLV